MRENHGAARHGKRTTEYIIWVSMRSRCWNENHPFFPRYGGRGIDIDARWNSFLNFLADMGPRPSSKHTLDRINNDGSYSPENCRWATLSEQNGNRRRWTRKQCTCGYFIGPNGHQSPCQGMTFEEWNADPYWEEAALAATA